MGEPVVPDLEKAIQLNRLYANCLRRSDGGIGWIDQYGRVAGAIHPGQRCDDERTFAQAVFDWQRSRPELVADGILGSRTWSQLARLPGNPRGSLLPPRSLLSLPGRDGSSGIPAGSDAVIPGRGFLFVVFEQLPQVGSRHLIRKVAVIPRDFALLPRNPRGMLSAAEHVLNLNPAQSQWLSASSRPFGAASLQGRPLLVDTAKLGNAGGRVLSTAEIVGDLRRFTATNPGARRAIDTLIDTISRIEGEVLIEGATPPRSARALNAAHTNYVRAAEELWSQHLSKQISRAELEAGLNSLDDAYKGARIVGRVGRVFTVVGVVLTVVDVTRATQMSIGQRSIRPIAAESIRQIGGWGGALAGAKLGFVGGAALGIETGPGAIITGGIGALIFGAAGYFGADWIADHISEN